MLHNLASGIVIALVFVTLIILFCVVLIRLYFTKIQNYTRLIYQKDLDFQKALNTTIIETQEQVLNNISQDLHDDAGQQLTYINFQLENLKLDSVELQQTLDPVSQSLANLSESIRSISHSLNNQLVIRHDIVKAIETETERLAKNGRIKIGFTCSESSPRNFSTNEKIIIYRIFQEITNNIFKHSGATDVEIGLSTIPYFKLTVSDNGKGFDHTVNGNTLGINGMIERAAVINYKLDIESHRGNGTTITLSEE